jgi:hypothetical protein
MTTNTTTRPPHHRGLITGLLAVGFALLAAAVLWLVVSTSSGASTEPARGYQAAEPCAMLERADNPHGPGALVSEQAVHWVTDEDRYTVNPNGPGAPASEHAGGGAC